MVNVAEAHTPDLKELADLIADRNGFPRETLRNVIETETGGTWDCSVDGKDGEKGCFQIIPENHPDVDPKDFVASAEYFIREYNNGHGWWWTGCSCVQSAKLTVKLPVGSAEDFKPNTTMDKGKIAILKYGKEYHIVSYKVVAGGLQTRFEGNFKPCLIQDRVISWKELNEHIVGFYAPEKSG